jgi:hypothetical protein
MVDADGNWDMVVADGRRRWQLWADGSCGMGMSAGAEMEMADGDGRCRWQMQMAVWADGRCEMDLSADEDASCG